MSVASLQQIFTAQPVDQKKLYEWNAENCVFRGADAPVNYPVIVKFGQPAVIRHAYYNPTDGKNHLVIVYADGSGSDSVVAARIKAGTSAQSDAFKNMKASAQDLRVPVATLKKDTLVAVGAFSPLEIPPITTGAGGIQHAPEPSYRLVGVVDEDVVADTSVVKIKAYVRGEHFLDNPEIVEVPVGAGDRFVPAAIEIGAAAVATFVNTALGHLLNRAGASVEGRNGLKFAGNPYSTMEDFYAAVIKPEFGKAGGKAYAKATEQPMLFSYETNATANEIDGAIANLKESAKAADTLEAAQNLRELLFGAPTPGPTPPPPSGNLEEQVRQLKEELGASRAAREALQRQFDAAKADLANVRKDLAEGERRVRIAEDKAAAAERARDNLQMRLGMQVARAAELETAVDELREQIASGATPEAREALAELAKVQGELETARAEIVALRIELAKTPGAGPVPVPIDKEEGERRVSELRAEIRKVTREIIQLNEKISANPADSDSRIELAEARARLAALDDELFALL